MNSVPSTLVQFEFIIFCLSNTGSRIVWAQVLEESRLYLESMRPKQIRCFRPALFQATIRSVDREAKTNPVISTLDHHTYNTTVADIYL